MSLSSFALSADSLIVAISLSGVVRVRHVAPLVALFGISDAGATAIGPTLAAQIPGSSLLGAIFLVLWGGLILLNLPTAARWAQSPCWAYLLPPLLSIDNLIVPSTAPAAGLASGAMAALGFALGFALLPRSVPIMPKNWWIGATLAAAGLLLAT
jgi:hypothetical protein